MFSRSGHLLEETQVSLSQTCKCEKRCVKNGLRHVVNVAFCSNFSGCSTSHFKAFEPLYLLFQGLQMSPK